MYFLKKLFVVLVVMGAMIPSFAFADDFGLKGASQDTGLIGQGQDVDAKTRVPELIGSIIGIALSFVGAIFFLLILYAGFLWMTAFGASDKVEKAKDILIHAAIGLIIVLAAYAISKFVFSNLGSLGAGSGAGSGGGSSAVATACPIGSLQGKTICGAADRSICDCDIGLNETCGIVGECVQKCDYANKYPFPSIGTNYACTNAGGDCPGANKFRRLGWCESNDVNIVCCYDGPVI
ncbi:MAG: hypothetical protein UT67_C0005G0018 [Candidatus Magasanikbacteria bacterium GW2011_GWA2_40_10]|uniref:Uncharacterized protein n=1 Tax=Candidatus Magasanikbacteria bacterium GW2011_GWA2_40_10 TaxID=1619037 RepID=A0A0G0QC42_9BACT|nr:MAG: hypothetical protein UT67_C0005G0018 [Candidatus Magasanikbacteria bacterium GW2011_GWA2_40_10]